MKTLRRLAVTLLVVTAVALQPTVIGPLRLPVGSPQLPVLVLAIIALVEGSGTGAVAGFATGLCSDALSTHPLGQQALVLTLVGWWVGKVREDGRRSIAAPLIAVVAGTAAALVGVTVVGLAVGTVEVRTGVFARELLASVAYAGLLAPLLLPPLRAMLVRLDPERSRR